MQKEQAKRLARAVVTLGLEIRNLRQENTHLAPAPSVCLSDGDIAAAGAIVASLVSGGREMLQDDEVL